MYDKTGTCCPRVNILLSAYNGEAYIKDQIESLVRQDYPNLGIYVRDDGSTDRTPAILKQCKRDFGKERDIHIFRGKNLGYGPSFLGLLKRCGQADYWAFCDQDDVWMPGKITRAVAWMESQEDRDKTPLLYHSAFYETDEKLAVRGIYLPEDREDYSFQKAVTECMHMGFSSLINARLRDLALKGRIRRIVSHDWWVELIVMAFGRAVFDPEPASYHRRLLASQSSAAMTARVRWFFKAMRSEPEIRNLAREFMGTFGQDMTEDDRKLLSLFVPPAGTGKTLKKAFYPARWRTSPASELSLRLLMLLGRL